MEHRFPFDWRIADGYPAKGIEKHGLRVFGTFVCGGGSSMGYKLAGYDHLGGVEIDPNVGEIYKANHHPKMFFSEDLREFNKRKDLPAELYNLDVLDGSPPCSTFSMAGSREKAWGKRKKFAEGQALQTLDDLVFVYCDTILKLRPKVFILENVSGLAKGNAKSYLKRIYCKLAEGGYKVQVFLLNSATMGVPQARERCFVIGRREDMGFDDLKLDFKEMPICFYRCIDKMDLHVDLSEAERSAWMRKRKDDKTVGDVRQREDGVLSGFTRAFVKSHDVCPTITTTAHILWDYPRKMNRKETLAVGSFPEDYDCPAGKTTWLVGMSVPPIMMAQISYEIYLQWFKNSAPQSKL